MDVQEGSEAGGDNRRPVASASLVPQRILDLQNFEEGQLFLGRTLSGVPFGWHDDLNIMTCAGTRSGKGVASVIPNLLTFPGSTVVIDPKGELAEATAAYRRDQLGQKVIVLDPANTAKIDPSLKGTYNPLSQLDPDDTLNVVSAAQSIASGIVIPNPNAKEPFWDQTALNFIQGVILYIINRYPPEDRTLEKLRQTLALGDWELHKDYLDIMREDDPEFESAPEKARDMLLDEMIDMDEYGGNIREAAMKLRLFGEQTQGNVLGGAVTHLDFLNEPKLWENLRHTDDPEHTFELSELRRQDQHITIYLCLPVDMMYQQGRWMRLIVSQIVQYIERTEFDKSRDYPILMMIDEFFQLGPMPSIVNTLTYAPGFGLRLWLIIQDINQLKANYPETWETILGACGIKQFFGFNDLTTAKYMSEMLGEYELDVPSVTLTRNSSQSQGTNVSSSLSQSVSSAKGTSESNSFSLALARSEGIARTRSFNTSHSLSHNVSDGTSYGTGTNVSAGSHDGFHEGTQEGTNIGIGYTGHYKARDPHTKSANAGASKGSSRGTSGGTSASRGISTNRSRNHQVSSGSTLQSGFGESLAANFGFSETETASSSKSRSQTDTRGTTGTDQHGSNRSQTQGESYSYTMSKQPRRVFRPEELLLSFTRRNLTQLVYIRDFGPMVLFRAPYYADPDFQNLLSHQEESEDE